MEKLRMVHLDFIAGMPRMEYLGSVVERLHKCGANSLLIEYEDKFPFQKHTQIVHEDAFSREELASFLHHVDSLGIKTVPLFQCLGHASYVLKHDAYKELREERASDWQYCPLHGDTFGFLNDCLEEIVEFHPNSEYVHIGCDETWNLCKCQDCQKYSPAVSYAEWVNRIHREIKKRWNKKTIIWGDMMVPCTCDHPTYPQIADILDKDIIIAYWDYWNSRLFPFLDFYKEKGFRVICSSLAAHPFRHSFQSQIQNITGFIEASLKYDNVIGNLVTCWGDIAPLWETVMFEFGVGLQKMVHNEKPLSELERDALNAICRYPRKELIEAFYMLSLPGKGDAPWKLYLARKAGSLFDNLNVTGDPAIRIIHFFTRIMEYKAEIINNECQHALPGEANDKRLNKIKDEIMSQGNELLGCFLRGNTLGSDEYFGKYLQ